MRSFAIHVEAADHEADHSGSTTVLSSIQFVSVNKKRKTFQDYGVFVFITIECSCHHSRQCSIVLLSYSQAVLVTFDFLATFAFHFTWLRLSFLPLSVDMASHFMQGNICSPFGEDTNAPSSLIWLKQNTLNVVIFADNTEYCVFQGRCSYPCTSVGTHHTWGHMGHWVI